MLYMRYCAWAERISYAAPDSKNGGVTEGLQCTSDHCPEQTVLFEGYSVSFEHFRTRPLPGTSKFFKSVKGLVLYGNIALKEWS